MGKKKLIIDPEFKALIPPLQQEEYAALEQSILRDGCRDALVVWKGILVDGHNRYEICNRTDKGFRTVPLERIDSRDGVMAWMLDNQLARRNFNDYQRGVLALKKEALLAVAAEKQKKGVSQNEDLSTNLSKGSAMDTRRDLAKAAGVSEGTLAKVKKIEKSGVPELVEKALAGEVKIDVAAQIASLSNEEQVALAAAGKDAMKAAAKEVRQASKQKQSTAREVAPEAKENITDPKSEVTSPPKDDDELTRLRAENAELRHRVKELTKAGKNPELKNQLADARAVNQRLNERCVELTSRIAELEKENNALVQRLSMQQQPKTSVEDRADDVLTGAELAAVVAHAAPTLPFFLVGASAA